MTRSETGYKSLRIPALLAERWLAINAIVSAVAAAVYVWHRSALAGDAAAVRASDERVVIVSVVEVIAVAIGVVLFIFWFFRAYSNHHSLGLPARYGRGWAIGGWFVPLLNLVRPKEIANDLWRGAERDPDPHTDWWKRRISPALTAWWALFLAASIVDRIAANLPGDTLADLRTATTWLIVAEVLWAVAAVAAVVAIRKITRRQQAAAERLGTA